MDKRSMKPVQRFLAVLLCLAMLLPMAMVPVHAEESTESTVSTTPATEAATEASDASESATLLSTDEEETPLAVVYAASDFQLKNSGKTGDDVAGAKAQMEAIVKTMKNAGYEDVDGALFCGDYSAYYNTWTDSKTDANNAGADAVAAVLEKAWGLTDKEVIYVQGNHDPADTKHLDVSGGHEFEHYSVFVIHEDDFQWKQGGTSSGNDTDAKTAALAIAEKLESYLQGKVDNKDDRPVFITAHVPLHMGYRTYKNYDNIYAKYLVDVLNKYGETLDIFFLFGHDHSSIYDDYIGGAAVYLPKGAKLLVPNEGVGETKDAYTEYTLNFTYMNAGYVGYYEGDCKPTKLSSTVFEIYEDRVEIARYDAEGETNLKDKGVWSTKDAKWSSTEKTNETVYRNADGVVKLGENPFNVDLDYGTLSSGKMAVENTGVLTVKGLYDTEYTVLWSSSNSDVVSVAPSTDTMSATLTAKAAGTAKITATVTEVGDASEAVTTAVGDQVTLEYNVEVLDTAEGTPVVLLTAGNHTYFKRVDSVVPGKVYAFIDIEDEGYLIGQQEALHYNHDNDIKENDSDKDANELNASGEDVFQLPIGSELLTLANITNEECWWQTATNSRGSMTVGSYNRNGYYLYVPEGDSDFLTYDSDQDRIRVRTSDPGSFSWSYDPEIGLVSTTKEDGFQYVLYYSQAQTDFSAYRINHNGAHGASKFNENGVLDDEQVTSRVYAFEQVTITLDHNITAQLDDTTGSVNKDVGYTNDDGSRQGGAQTGDNIILNNGTMTVNIPVTIDMLSGSFDVTAPGTYGNLTVTYAGYVVTDSYTLVVNDSATILKNDAAREYMDTIYALVNKWVSGRQYLIVDTNEDGIGHAMGASDSGTVTAHNVQVQELPVDGKDGVYVDSSRYSNKADETATGLVGRGITDQGDINALQKGGALANYQKAISLVWSVTQRFFPTDGDPEISDVRSNEYYFLMSQMQVAKKEANRTLYIGANAEDTQLKLGSSAYTSGWETDNPSGATPDWWWELWQYSTSQGVHLSTANVAHAYLFYNWQNIIGDTADGAATKNFQTEEAKDGDFTLYPYRRVWIYERVTNIDTVSARISDKYTEKTVRIEGVSESTHASTFTGDYILVDTTHADGSVTNKQVPITISMLSGTYDLTKVGTYPNLTVTYQGVAVCTDYTLKIIDYVANDYPEFPDEGAVRIDKQLDTTQYNYLKTGVASIDLSVTGIPAQSGVNLVVILDASSSMQNCPHGTGAGYMVGGTSCSICKTVEYKETRMGLMEATLESMLNQLQKPINGYTPDVDVAIATFNGYTLINSSYEFWYKGTKSNGGTSNLTHSNGQQIQEERPDASQILLTFTSIEDVNPSFKNEKPDDRDIDYNKGTNYDRAMELAYDLLKEKQDQDALDGITKDAVVVFMSDGSPYQFNYFHGDPNMTDWAEYLQGNLTASSDAVTSQSDAVQSVFAKYNNAKGKHWLAEAIKADPNTTKKIIDPDAMTTDHITYVNGLGATMYTIAFGLGNDNMVSAEVAGHVLEQMATDADHFMEASDGSELEAAFSKIAGEVRSAGNAVFKDQMGTKFDLVTSNKMEIVNDQGKPETIDLTSNPPTITVKTYDLYKRSEIGTTVNGVLVTETMVGTRKSDVATVREKVTFNDDGTAAYTGDTTTNILVDGVICANTFWYNTSKTDSKTITVNGKSITLEPETFYWNIGDIPEKELVLSYSVYLSGSMEGLREQGTYDTNNFATLTYTNYLGHNCEQNAPSPKLPWKQGTVGYAFYLVDQNGNPIINQSTGQIGSFEQSVKITSPVYLDFYLNSVGADVMSEIIEADNVMPEGYTLFDTGAEYEVSLESYGVGFYEVTIGRADRIKTTYVVGIEDNAFKPDAGKVSTTNYATANTIVWFAVVAETKAVPDTVVIDFGLPVDINVVGNDTMMGDFGELSCIGKADSFQNYDSNGSVKLWQYLQTVPVTSDAVFTTNKLQGGYGTMEVLFDDTTGKSTGMVRYTPANMEMNAEDTFVYAVNYTGSIGTQGYYYSTVTVIPATSIYYEDSFLTYVVKDYDTAKVITDPNVQWTDTGTATDAVQAEDRPGEFSLSSVDANNIYGYDGAYADCSIYSLENAKKVTVGKQTLSDNTEVVTYATATFTFWGTGFDIISVTSNTTGTIVTKVVGAGDDNRTFKKNYIVDTYYGYYYDEETGSWIVASGDTAYPEGENALYQIPVMKVADLPYGKYTVTISASYKDLYDHGQYDGEVYDFYLDAVRIYDPANDGENSQVIEDAYVADGEGWPSYQELRNILISAKDFDAIIDGQQTSGAIFIDNTTHGENTTYTINDYQNYGPNNELYLAPGQSVAFKLEAGSNVAGVHLAMKSVGGSVDVKVYANGTEADVAVQSINTATDLYYDITDLNGKVVVIKNESGEGGNILSITNIKTTYLSDPNGEEATTFVMSRSVAAVALASLESEEEETVQPDASEPETSEPEDTKPEDTEPETSEPEASEPEVTEPQTFEPKSLKVEISKSEVKVGSTVTVTVTASDDVDYITINGEKVESRNNGRRKGSNTWQVRVKAEEVGEMEIAVVCYNSDGVASNPVVESVTVTEQYNNIRDRLEDFLRRLLDGLWNNQG